FSPREKEPLAPPRTSSNLSDLSEPNLFFKVVGIPLALDLTRQQFAARTSDRSACAYSNRRLYSPRSGSRYGYPLATRPHSRARLRTASPISAISAARRRCRCRSTMVALLLLSTGTAPRR